MQNNYYLFNFYEDTIVFFLELTLIILAIYYLYYINYKQTYS